VSAIRKTETQPVEVPSVEAPSVEAGPVETRPAEALLAVVLSAMGAELKALALRNERLQLLIGQLLSDAGPDANLPPSVYELQEIDRATQIADNLAAFTEELARQAGPDWAVDMDRALASVTLRDLAVRLADEPRGGGDAGAGDGDCSFF